MELKAKGKNFLLVSSIIFIVLAAFAAIGAVGVMVTLGVLNGTDQAAVLEIEKMLATQGTTRDMLTMSMIISIVTAVLYLVIGIIGIMNRKKPEKAQICIVLGGILLALLLANAVYSLIQGAFAVVSIAINCGLALLYLYGGIANKQSVE